MNGWNENGLSELVVKSANQTVQPFYFILFFYPIKTTLFYWVLKVSFTPSHGRSSLGSSVSYPLWLLARFAAAVGAIDVNTPCHQWGGQIFLNFVHFHFWNLILNIFIFYQDENVVIYRQNIFDISCIGNRTWRGNIRTTIFPLKSLFLSIYRYFYGISVNISIFSRYFGWWTDISLPRHHLHSFPPKLL